MVVWGGGGGGAIVLEKGDSRDEKGKLLRSCPNHLHKSITGVHRLRPDV